MFLTAGRGDQVVEVLSQVSFAHPAKDTLHFAAVRREEDKDRLVGNAKGLHDTLVGGGLTVEVKEVHLPPILSF
jgi:hypothetical protein